MAKQRPPTELWPTLDWEDISSEYASLYFQALDELSETLAETESYPELNIQSGLTFDGKSFRPINDIELKGSQLSPFLTSGSYGGKWTAIRFLSNQRPVQPITHLIRIWKRVIKK